MNAVGLAQATAHVVPDVLAENRFKKARQSIEASACIRPLGPIVWVTTETMGMDPNKCWQDMGHGVFRMVGE